MRLNIRHIARRLQNILAHDPARSPLTNQRAKRCEDICAAALGTKRDAPAAARGDHKRRIAVVIRVAICVWADILCGAAVFAFGAFRCRVVFPRAAVLCRPCLLAGREAWVKDGPGDAVVWVRVDTCAWLRRGWGLEGPRTPVADVGVGLGTLVGHGICCVCVVGGSRAVGGGEVALCGDAGGRDEVGRWCGAVGSWVGEVFEAKRDIVPVHEGNVNKVL